MERDQLYRAIGGEVKRVASELNALSDQIHQWAEIGFEEHRSCRALCSYLEAQGFAVQSPFAGLDTAFEAVWEAAGGVAAGGPNIGLLCEYDALAGQGHGCAHHMQGPAIIGAALAIRAALGETLPYRLTVQGTPAEESLEGGKTVMAEQGAFSSLDVALMVHGGRYTQIDTPSLALIEFDVEYFGTASHAGIAPEKGRSAVDAVTLLQTGLALLRGHVCDGVRMNNIVLDGGQAVNSIAPYAKVKVELRATQIGYLDELCRRAHKVVEAAAMATETTCKITPVARLANTVINPLLSELVLDCARDLGCADIMPPRGNPGSTDFGAVTNQVPSCCLRVKTIDQDWPAHSAQWVEAGTQPANYQGIVEGASALAAAGCRLIQEPETLQAVQRVHRELLA